MSPSSTSDILTPDDVAAWLRVSVKWLYDHTSRSKPIVPHLKLGGHLRFRRGDVERWLDEQVRDEI
jgi:excisionase family DNA binding protein